MVINVNKFSQENIELVQGKFIIPICLKIMYTLEKWKPESYGVALNLIIGGIKVILLEID